MFNSPTCNEISQPVVAPPGCMFDELTATLSTGDSSAELKSMLFEWFHQQESGTPRTQEKRVTTRVREINTPPQEVGQRAHPRGSPKTGHRGSLQNRPTINITQDVDFDART